MIALLPKRPPVYRKLAKYRAGTFKVETVIMNPQIAKQSGTATWNPRSLLRSEDIAMPNAMSVLTRYGGAVQIRLIVVDPKLNPLMIVGKKLLKPYAE
jgi:hypothetical protein